jgi:hypothetical protein
MKELKNINNIGIKTIIDQQRDSTKRKIITNSNYNNYKFHGKYC